MSAFTARVRELADHAEGELEYALEDSPRDRHWLDYVDRRWILRTLRAVMPAQAQRADDDGTGDGVYLDALTDAFWDEVIRQHLEPIHCPGQRQFKLTA